MKSFLKYSATGSFFLTAATANAVSTSPYILVDESVFGLPITNSMVTSWVISLFIIIAVKLIAFKPTLIPTTGQAVLENVMGGIKEIMEPIVGKKLISKVFPLLMGLFVFILMQNWSGLIPGVGAFGFYDEHNHLKYWFRPGNADLNMSLALAIVASVVGWFYFVLRYAGAKTLAIDIFGNKSDRKEVGTVMWIILWPLFIGVGFIEVISIIFRPISLSFRLFGNVFGGENLLTNMTGLVGWFVPVPFYFLELLIGLVQALVFTLLTAVYIGLICNHGDDEGHAH